MNVNDIVLIPESMLGFAAAMGRIPTPQEAFQIFCTPPRITPARKEAEVLARGERFEIEHRGDRVACWSWGEGPTVVLLHGWGGCAGQMTAFVAPLTEAGFRVIAQDHPAHGESEGELCYAPKVRDCLLIHTEKAGELAGIVTHSFGSIGANLAQDMGLKVKSVVELAPFCWIEQRFREFCRAVGMDSSAEEKMLDISDEYFGRGYLRSKAADLIAHAFRAKGLLIHDVDDREIPIIHAEAIAKAWPDCELVRTTGLGHGRILRSRTVVQQAVDFIRGQAGPEPDPAV